MLEVFWDGFWDAFFGPSKYKKTSSELEAVFDTILESILAPFCVHVGLILDPISLPKLLQIRFQEPSENIIGFSCNL